MLVKFPQYQIIADLFRKKGGAYQVRAPACID